MAARQHQLTVLLIGLVAVALSAVLLRSQSSAFAIGSASDHEPSAGVAGVSATDSVAGVEQGFAPRTFNYQGILRMNDGSLANGTYNITLAVYDLPAGGNKLFEEPLQNLPIQDGAFSAVLGATPAHIIDDLVFASRERYVGISVNSDPEMVPRQRVHPVPWALQAEKLLPGAVMNDNGVKIDVAKVAAIGGGSRLSAISGTTDGTGNIGLYGEGDNGVTGKAHDCVNCAGVWGIDNGRGIAGWFSGPVKIMGELNVDRGAQFNATLEINYPRLMVSRVDGSRNFGIGSRPGGGNTEKFWIALVGDNDPGGGVQPTDINFMVPTHQVSDASLKRDITPIDHALDKLARIRGSVFTWRESGKRDDGVIAQDVERVFPELVVVDSGEGVRAVNYNGLTGVLIEAVRELKIENDAANAQIDALLAKNDQLQSDMNDLRRRVEALETGTH